MNYYLTSLRKENYEILEDNNFELIGFNEKSHLAEKLQSGDIIILYIGSRVSKIAGYVSVTDKYYWDTELIWDDVFPKRVKIKPIRILEAAKMIDIRALIPSLSFVTNKERYGMSFLAGLRQIPEEDAKYMIEQVERRKENGI